jgi:hypothetical protein
MTYQEGVERLAAAEPSNALLKVLRKGENSFTRDLLRDTLATLPRSHLGTPPPRTEAVLAPPRANPQRKMQRIDTDSLHPSLQRIYHDKLLPLYRERTAAHVLLKASCSDTQQSRLLSLQIVHISAKCRRYLNMIEDWQQRGILPEAENELSLFEIYKEKVSRLQTNRSFISRCKGPEAQAHKEERLKECNELIGEISQIEQDLIAMT